MKKLLFLLICPLLIFACGSNNSISVTGNVGDAFAGCDSVFLVNIQADGSVNTIASSALEKGTFKLQGTLNNTPAICNIVTYNKQGRVNNNIDIIAEGEPLTVTKVAERIRVAGSLLNDKLQEYNDSLLLVKTLYRRYYDKKMHTPTLSEKAVDEADKVMEVTALYHRNIVYRAIERNIDNPLGLHIIKMNFNIIEPDMGLKFIESLPVAHQKDYLISYMYKYYNAVAKYYVGASFADFVLQNIEGKDNYLSDFVGRDKPVVVSVWASDNLRSLNEQVKEKEFEEQFADKVSFVGVSLDTKRKQWLATIERVAPVGVQLTDFKGWNNAVLSIYGIDKIPYYILIDKNGIINYRGLEQEALFNCIAKLLQE